MIEQNDSELRDRFRALRREDAAAARPFDATLASARARRAARPRHRRGWLAAAAVVVAAVAVVLLFTRPDRHGRTIGLATVRWEGPTDFLLVLPGDELLRTTPRFGRMNLSSLSDRRTP